MAKKKKTQKWKVVRKGKSRVELVLPDGYELTGKGSLNVEDVAQMIQDFEVLSRGTATSDKGGGEIIVKCCHGNMALA